ncbi:MAG: hypothetical protein LBQ18_00120 [Campylobacteraceae bacterium]|jgi:hypothetical protein|nr:hypothetical protein [Campylobacteraceae bacterium]
MSNEKETLSIHNCVDLLDEVKSLLAVVYLGYQIDEGILDDVDRRGLVLLGLRIEREIEKIQEALTVLGKKSV